MNNWSYELFVRFFLTALFLIVVLPLAIAVSWVSITYHAVWGYLLAVLTGLLTLGFLVSFPRFWRGYGHELRELTFPDYLSPYRPLPTLTDTHDNDTNDGTQV